MNQVQILWIWLTGSTGGRIVLTVWIGCAVAIFLFLVLQWLQVPELFSVGTWSLLAGGSWAAEVVWIGALLLLFLYIAQWLSGYFFPGG